MLHDFRYALRTLTRTPLLTTVIVATLALGVGVTTAIFGVVDALLFKPLPYPGADRLYAVGLANDQPAGYQFWPYPKYQALAAEESVFEAIAAYTRQTATVVVAGQPHRVDAEVVTASYFPLLGVRAAHGRTFLDSENTVASRDAVVVLSDSFWRTHFAADPRVLGTTVAVKDRAYEIVGVAPAGFRGQSGAVDLWLPVMMADDFFYKGAVSTSASSWLRVAARAKPGLDAAALDGQLGAITARVAEASPSRPAATRNGQERIQLIPFKDTKVDPAVSRSFVLLLAAVAFVLVIACANTANLLLGRAVARQREFAVRRALGASTSRVARHIVAESLLLAAASGVAGLVVSMWTLGWLAAAKPMNTVGFWSLYASTFDYFDISLDWRVALFNVAIALLIGAIVGAVPARQASRGSLDELLRQGSGASPAGFRRVVTVRGALVLMEIASSLVLLIGAGLVIRSFATATSADLGFDPRRLMAMTFSSTDRTPLAFYQDLLERVRSVPGVEQAALATGAPLSGGTSSGTLTLEGAAPGQPVSAQMNVVTSDFFAAFSIRLRAGRYLTADDRGTAPRAALVSRTLAEQAWPGQDAVGKRFKHPFRVAYGDASAWTTVVGVVDDVVYGTLEDPREPVVYLPLSQPLGSPDAVALAPATIAVRSSLEPAALAAAVREQVRSLDPAAPV